MLVRRIDDSSNPHQEFQTVGVTLQSCHVHRPGMFIALRAGTASRLPLRHPNWIHVSAKRKATRIWVGTSGLTPRLHPKARHEQGNGIMRP